MSIVTELPGVAPILGVEFKLLRTHPDERGFFREIIRTTDPFFDEGGFGQWSHSRMARNVVKAWHYHHQQTDWWYVGIGQIETVLYDNREESTTYRTKQVFRMGESCEQANGEVHQLCVKIPPGVLHGLKVLSEEAHLFYITSQTYNPNDEGRFPFDSDVVGHDWGEGVLTAENDRRTFVPTSPRV